MPIRVNSTIVDLALAQIFLVADPFFFEDQVICQRYEVLRAKLSLLPTEGHIEAYFRKVLRNEALLNQPRFVKDNEFHRLSADNKLNYLAERLSSKPREELKIFLQAMDAPSLQAKL